MNSNSDYKQNNQRQHSKTAILSWKFRVPIVTPSGPSDPPSSLFVKEEQEEEEGRYPSAFCISLELPNFTALLLLPLLPWSICH